MSDHHPSEPQNGEIPPHHTSALEQLEAQVKGLRKEAVESRNEAIRTGNAVQVLSGTVKEIASRQQVREKRHLLNSIAAYVIFVLLITILLYHAFDVRLSGLKSERKLLQQRARRAEGFRARAEKRLAGQRESRAKANRVWRMLTGKPSTKALSAYRSLDLKHLTDVEREVFLERYRSVHRIVALAKLNAGRRALTVGRYGSASPLFQEATALQVDSSLQARIRYFVGLAAYRRGKCRAALKALRQVIEYGGPRIGHEAEAYYLSARCWEKLGNGKRALWFYETLQRRFKSSSLARRARRRLATLRGRRRSRPGRHRKRRRRR